MYATHTEPYNYQIYRKTLYTCVCMCVCTQLCPTLCDPMDCNLPDSSVHGIFQARLLEWVAISSSRGFSQLRDQTHVSYIGRQILYQLHCMGSPYIYMTVYKYICMYICIYTRFMDHSLVVAKGLV